MERELSKSARPSTMDGENSGLHLSLAGTGNVSNLRRLFNTRNRRRSGVAFLVALLALIGLAEYRSIRVSRVEAALKSIDAEYQWNLDETAPSLTEYPKSARQLLAQCFGNSMVSDFSSVRIKKEDLAEEHLEFLANLRSLESLELHSNGVTDDTLKTVSELPELRFLSLGGEHFSIFGLLELRNSENLERLNLDTDHLTPNEMALLASELDGVQLGRGELGKPPSILIEEHPLGARPRI